MAVQARWRERILWVMFAFVLPLFSIVLLVFLARDAGPAVRAGLGDGRAGTLHLTQKTCLPHSCSWFGTFRSDDGTEVRSHVLMQDYPPGGAKVGDDIRARDTGDRSGVFAETGSRAWLFMAFLAVLSGGYLIGSTVWVARRLAGKWRPAGRKRPAPVELPGG
ncbi:MAG: hypothetical protein J2P15_00600 [Micromonosporaceae bacterium]|nr:hypothetical protein [Micromonosporaceae bacterium]